MARSIEAAVGRGRQVPVAPTGAGRARRDASDKRTPAAGRGRRCATATALIVLAGLALAACTPRVGGPSTGPSVTTVPSPPAPTETAAPDDGVAKVALLLPITGGPPGGIVQMMSQAAELAAINFGSADFELLPRDTGGTEPGAAAAARDALADGADLILGPFFGRNVPGVAELARADGVNVIAFTTDASYAGGNVLVMGFLPGNEVDRIMQYGLRQGIADFGVIAPDWPYGRAVVQAARAVAEARGARLTSVDYYPAEAGDYTPFADTAFVGGLPGAVLMPDAGLRLRAVASLLPVYGVGDTQILGTGIWAGQPIGGEPALVGAWFAAPQPSLRTSFEQDYAAVYGQSPAVVATLAYDAVSLAATLAGQPGFAGYGRDRLTDPRGFRGTSGIFRFDGRTGLVERGLAVLQVTETGTSVRDPAPNSFMDAGL